MHVSTLQRSPSSKALLESLDNTSDPVTFFEVVTDPKWCQEMDAELQALEENGTWKITSLPLSKQAIGCKWIYRTKFKSDGSVDKRKARLVALGCRQKFGVDYWETFAPVAKMTTVRTLLVVASIQQWHLVQMDVSNAFLHGDLHEEVYMTLPLGYAGFGQLVQPGHPVSAEPQMVCKLEKPLYGLKEAPRKWFEKLSEALLQFGFTQSRVDYTLFSNYTRGSLTAVLVYVDDMIITGTHLDSLSDLKAYLCTHFHMKDLDPLSYFLGLEIFHTTQGLFLCQRKYTKDLLAETKMEHCRPLKVP